MLVTDSAPQYGQLWRGWSSSSSSSRFSFLILAIQGYDLKALPGIFLSFFVSFPPASIPLASSYLFPILAFSVLSSFYLLCFFLLLAPLLPLPLAFSFPKVREGAFITSKSLTVQFKLEITRRHPILGVRSQHLGGGW